MSLPLSTRAFALVAALSTTAAVITVVSEIGHPPPSGTTFMTRWTSPRDAARDPSLNAAVPAKKAGTGLVAIGAGREP